ncbi:MAG: zf-HC2 domain-containing protein [Bryobacteraceae bacterium]|jgi:hypothetical protein
MAESREAERHVDGELLERYAMDRTTETEAAPIEEHLLVCSRCRDRLSDLDAYIPAIRAALRKLGEPLCRRAGNGV